MELQSILDNVIFLDIETTGLDPSKGEIIEIGAIKIKNNVQSTFSTLIRPINSVPVSIIHLCTGLNMEELNKAPLLENIEKQFYDFIEDMPIICHNGNFERRFLSHHFHKFSNVILDSMELASILEPGLKSFNLEELLHTVTNFNKKEAHRGLEDSYDTLALVNALLCRLWQAEDLNTNKETIHKTITKLFSNSYKWNWTDYLLKPIMFTPSNYTYVRYSEDKVEYFKQSNRINYSKYEELLRETNIWNSGNDFNYTYRKDQELISKKIRENFEANKRIFIEAPTGSGKTFAYVLIAAIAAFTNKINKRYEESNFIISTDTKELQNQLIEKDIPNIIRKLGLENKIKYGAMKGKGNYLCFDRLIKCREFEEVEDGLLSLLFLRRLGEEGLYGDLESINYWAQKHYKLDYFKKHVNCDSEDCNLDKCSKPCFLRTRYNELPQENITVINHSLLASWPYSEKRKIFHLILDEAHNLMEKAYDFFTEEFNSYEFLELLEDIDIKRPSILFLLHRLNGKYNYKEVIDKSLVLEKSKAIEFNIINLLNEFNRLDLNNGEYNFKDEYFNAEEVNKPSLESSRELISDLKSSIYSLYKVLDTYIRKIVSEDEQDGSNEYKTLVNYTIKLKNAFDTIDNFLYFTTDFAKILEIHKEFGYFILKNTPLNIGNLINENILKEVKSTAFLSATLRIDNSFFAIKKLLGQELANTINIPPVFDLRRRTKIFSVKDVGSYKDNMTFIKNTANFIFDIAKKLSGHILVLFNNNNRRELVEMELSRLVRSTNFEVHTSKKAIAYLKDQNRNIIILGSKGFFEGIDVPGDALNCVIIDKIPNVNPTEPLYKALKAYRKVEYRNYNYPKVCIKMKQSYGRLIRSTLDYGYFIILDSGTNNSTLNFLQRDLGGPVILNKNRAEILEQIDADYSRWQKENLWNTIKVIPKANIITEFNESSIKRNLFWELIDYDKVNDEYSYKYKSKLFKINNIH